MEKHNIGVKYAVVGGEHKIVRYNVTAYSVGGAMDIAKARAQVRFGANRIHSVWPIGEYWDKDGNSRRPVMVQPLA